MAKHITFEQWKKQNPERLNDWRTCTNCYGSGDDELTCRACEYCNGEGSINKAREYYVADLMFDDMRLKAWSESKPQPAADGVAPCDCEDPLYMELTGECEKRCKAARQ